MKLPRTQRSAATLVLAWAMAAMLAIGLAAPTAHAQAPEAPSPGPPEAPEAPAAPAAPNAADAPDAAGQAGDQEADPPAASSVVGWLELSGPLRDGPSPFAWVSEADAGPSLTRVLQQLERIATQEQYLGLVIYFDQPELTLTQINALGDAIRRVREADKRVLTFAESYDMLDYMLATNADLILLQHRGAVELGGLSLEELYLRGLLEKVGVQADLMQVGQFKGADEPMTRDGPSDAWERNMSGLLDDLYEQIIGRIAEGRGLNPQEMEAVIGDSWQMADADYLRRRVVDRLTDRDMVDVTELEFGDAFVWDDVMGRAERRLQTENPFAMFSRLFRERRQTTRRDTVAVVRAVGPVTSGESGQDGGLFGGEAIGSRTLVKALGEIRDDEHVKAVVLRIDSPGGSALASEVIWQAVRDLAEHKPVFASIDGMAASGGYYIACAADEIYVSPQSIVGSIGVVGGKIVLGGLYEKLGVTVHRRSRGPMADMFNSVEPFTDEQREAVQAGLNRIYEQFLDRVAIGRGNRLADPAAVAEGRLFTGRQSTQNGMADAVGGLSTALAAAAERAGLDAGEYDVMHLPEPMGLGEFLESLIGVHGPQPGVHHPRTSVLIELAREALGPDGWRSARSVLAGLMLLRDEPALTLMPYAIIVR